jgi:hypothetical protein
LPSDLDHPAVADRRVQGPPTYPAAGFEHHCLLAGRHKLARGEETGKACADHYDIGIASRFRGHCGERTF